MHDVLGAVGSARHHKEGGGDKRPKVRRTDFFRLGTREGCGIRGWVALAVANFDVFLLGRLTLSYSARLVRCRASQLIQIPGITAEVSSQVEITGIFHGCNNIFEKFCQSNGTGTEVIKVD